MHMAVTCGKHHLCKVIHLLVLVWLLWLPLPAQAADVTGQLDAIEKQVYARTYSQESPAERLSRLETTIFGAPQQRDAIESRLQALGQFFQPTSPMPAQGTTQPPTTQATRPTPELAPDESRYPTVTAMENQVLQQTFEQEPLEKRLIRLEQRVYGRSQVGSLQDRSDRLQETVLGNNTASQPLASASSTVSSYTPSMGSSSSSSPSGNPGQISAELLQALPAVEQRILHQSFPNDSVENRLSRLETRLFNAPAPEMAPEDRLYRIVSVANAQQSSRSEQALRGGFPPFGPGAGPYYSGNLPRASSGPMGIFGSMLLMVLMSLL